MIKFRLDNKTEAVLPGLVVAATFLAYAGTLGFGFVYDDQGQIVRNLYIQSWQYVPRYFTSHVWSYLFPGNVANYYRPAFLLWLRVNDALFGLEPAGWHLTSVLAHLAVTLEIYWLGIRLLEDGASAAVAAALFGLHPIHVEAVAWVSGVTDPLAAALMLGSFLSHLRARERGRRKVGWWAASLGLYTLAMLSKETALIFPALIFIYAWLGWRPRGAERGARPANRRTGQFLRVGGSLLQVAPYLALAAAYLPLRIRALGGFSHPLTPVPAATSLLTWPSLLWFYVKKLIWPSALSPFYDLPYVTRLGVRDVGLPAAGLTLLVGLLWVWARRKSRAGDSASESRTLVLACAWMCLPLTPLVDLSVFGAGDIAHDRYLYIPSIGAALVAAACWKRFADRVGTAQSRRAVAGALAIAVAAALGASTVRASSYWSDNLSLYSRGVSVAPESIRARLDLANAACDRGLYNAGLELYSQVIERAPNFPLAFYDLGVTELELGRLEAADHHLTRAVELNGNDPGAYYSLGLARFREGRLEQSAGLFRRALAIQPDAVGYHLALGRALDRMGNDRDALEEFRAEYAAHPQMVEARNEMLRLERILSQPRKPVNRSDRPVE